MAQIVPNRNVLTVAQSTINQTSHESFPTFGGNSQSLKGLISVIAGLRCVMVTFLLVMNSCLDSYRDRGVLEMCTYGSIQDIFYIKRLKPFLKENSGVLLKLF